MIRAGSIAGGARKRSIKGLAGRSEETMCRAHVRKLQHYTQSHPTAVQERHKNTRWNSKDACRKRSKGWGRKNKSNFKVRSLRSSVNTAY